MKMRAIVLALGTTLLLSGCQNMDSNGLMSSGAEAFQAYSLSDAQVKALSDQACKDMDGKATLAPANSTYTQRLNKIASALGDNINGQPVNYKVYMAKDVNAFAMANGCIRVYSGLMDMMTDNEVEAVIGHEMGHVALGHVKKGMQVALGTNAIRAVSSAACHSRSLAMWVKNWLTLSSRSVRNPKRMTTPTICCANAALIHQV